MALEKEVLPRFFRGQKIGGDLLESGSSPPPNSDLVVSSAKPGKKTRL